MEAQDPKIPSIEHTRINFIAFIRTSLFFLGFPPWNPCNIGFAKVAPSYQGKIKRLGGKIGASSNRPGPKWQLGLGLRAFFGDELVIAPLFFDGKGLNAFHVLLFDSSGADDFVKKPQFFGEAFACVDKPERELFF